MTRCAVNGIGWAPLPSETHQQLAAGISVHLDRAVVGVCDATGPTAEIAIWELHLAVEKALKVFLAQKSIAVPNTHDLTRLRSLAKGGGLSTDAGRGIDNLPTHREANAHRYGEVPAPTPGYLMSAYLQALEVISRIARELDHGWISDHATIHIQALPWHPSRAGQSDES